MIIYNIREYLQKELVHNNKYTIKHWVIVFIIALLFALIASIDKIG